MNRKTGLTILALTLAVVGAVLWQPRDWRRDPAAETVATRHPARNRTSGFYQRSAAPRARQAGTVISAVPHGSVVPARSGLLQRR